MVGARTSMDEIIISIAWVISILVTEIRKVHEIYTSSTLSGMEVWN